MVKSNSTALKAYHACAKRNSCSKKSRKAPKRKAAGGKARKPRRVSADDLDLGTLRRRLRKGAKKKKKQKVTVAGRGSRMYRSAR